MPDKNTKLTVRNLRLRKAMTEFLQVGEQSHPLIYIDEADVQLVLGKHKTVAWYTIEGDSADCVERIRECLDPSIEGAALYITAETLEEVEAFLAAVGDSISEEGHMVHGVSWYNPGEGSFRADLLLPAVQSIRGDYSIPLDRSDILQSPTNTYRDLEVFDAGSGTICYRAVDNNGCKVLIKEVYPVSMSGWLARENGALVPATQEKEIRQAVVSTLILAIERSRREKEMEKELNNGQCEFFERYRDFFEVNNTCYTVYYDYGQGTLAELAGKLDVRQAVVLAGRILEHLEALHEMGFLHLDISPENILMGAVVDGVRSLKFIDLGSLMHKGRIEDATSFPCKDGYSPFELFGAVNSPENRAMISEASDTFSVGAVLYNLLTGRKVNWSVCRQGSGPMIKADDAAVQLSSSRRVVFDSKAAVVAEPYAGVSPRVLDTLNAFLAKALTNNPHSRFRTAAEMREEVRSVLKEIDAGDYFFGKMEMPASFMEEAVELEEATILSRENWVFRKALQDPVYETEDIRESLVKKHSAILNKCSLRRSREAAAEYIAQYGHLYHEILFVDESAYDAELFSGNFTGSHVEPRLLKNDEKTLIVFYGRERKLSNGIVEMVEKRKDPATGEETSRPVYSLEFAAHKGSSRPDVIRILPRRANETVSRTSRAFFTGVCVVPLVLLIGMSVLLGRNPFLLEPLEMISHPELDPNGAGWFVLQVRELLGHIPLFGPVDWLPMGADLLFYGSLRGSCLLVKALLYWGLLPVLMLLMVCSCCWFAFWDLAKKTYLSAAAYVVMTARMLTYLLSNVGLLPDPAGPIWTSLPSVIFHIVLLAMIFVWPHLSFVHSRRANGWTFLRVVYGLLGQGVLSLLWSGTLEAQTWSLTYILLTLALAFAIDFSVELAMKHYHQIRKRRAFEEARELGDEDWMDIEDYFTEEEIRGMTPLQRRFYKGMGFMFADDFSMDYDFDLK